MRIPQALDVSLSAESGRNIEIVGWPVSGEDRDASKPPRVGVCYRVTEELRTERQEII